MPRRTESKQDNSQELGRESSGELEIGSHKRPKCTGVLDREALPIRATPSPASRKRFTCVKYRLAFTAKQNVSGVDAAQRATTSARGER